MTAFPTVREHAMVIAFRANASSNVVVQGCQRLNAGAARSSAPPVMTPVAAAITVAWAVALATADRKSVV